MRTVDYQITEGGSNQLVSTDNYLHRDHLGSVETVTDSLGNVIQRLSFDPWGKRQLATWGTGDPDLTALPTNRGYTGHEMLDSEGLIHMNGRVYETKGHIWTSPICQTK